MNAYFVRWTMPPQCDGGARDREDTVFGLRAAWRKADAVAAEGFRATVWRDGIRVNRAGGAR